MNLIKILFSLPLLTIFITLSGQDYRLPLYRESAPNSMVQGKKEKIEKTDITLVREILVPDINVYIPSKRMATRQAILICPGGGYGLVVTDLEGTDIAGYLNSIGIAAIVLKYRQPVFGNWDVPSKIPLMDAQRAMRMVRFNANKWNIDPHKIGVMGFSAGGHLASTLGTHFDYGNSTSEDSIEKISCRPDFMILMYPVITFNDSCRHQGSMDNLLGKNPDKALVLFYSNELQVKEDTPPTFIVHAIDDSVVPVENSLLFYKALRSKKVPVEMHILSEGEHGFGLGVGNEHIGTWTNNLKYWLHWLNK